MTTPYFAIRQALAPHRRVLDWLDLRALASPSDPPDDPEWLTPATESGAKSLLARLDWPGQLVAIDEVTQMALEIWRAWPTWRPDLVRDETMMQTPPPPPDDFDFRWPSPACCTIEAMGEAVAIAARTGDVPRPRIPIGASPRGVMGAPDEFAPRWRGTNFGWDAAWAVAHAYLGVAYPREYPDDIQTAFRVANDAAVAIQPLASPCAREVEFWGRWWCRVRCRLAFDMRISR